MSEATGYFATIDGHNFSSAYEYKVYVEKKSKELELDPTREPISFPSDKEMQKAFSFIDTFYTTVKTLTPLFEHKGSRYITPVLGQALFVKDFWDGYSKDRAKGESVVKAALSNFIPLIATNLGTMTAIAFIATGYGAPTGVNMYLSLDENFQNNVNNMVDNILDTLSITPTLNPLDPPPFPQTTSSLNEELYNKDKTIYEAYDLAKKSTNAMLVYNLALKQAAEHAPDTDKMRDIMYSIITEKKDCFSEGIFSVINNSEDVFNSIAANPGKYGLPDPIAIDLDGDGIETVSKEKSTAYFDLDKNGYAEKTGWISGDDALLVRDINGNSIIDDSSELFGENTALAGGGTAATGYQALSDLDSNNDGKLSSEDDAFNELKIWQDKNQDGISQADELMSLEEAGIKNISLDTVNINSGDGNGNIIEKVSKVEFEDGKVTQAGQFRFATDTLISLI